MGLKEILAAKKAAIEAAMQATAADTTTTTQPEQPKFINEEEAANHAYLTMLETKVEDAPNNSNSPVSQPEPVAAPVSPLADLSSAQESAVSSAPEKPLTFAEKLALKRQGVTAAQSVPQVPKEIKPVAIDPALIPEDPADAQAYVDIKTKIHELENKFDDDLKGAMSELKAALKKNPNAAELMLDSDIGKMVTALRRMTHVAQVEATTKTKAGKTKTAAKAKDVALTKEEIEAAFDEL